MRQIIPQSSQNSTATRLVDSASFDPDVFDASVVGCTVDFRVGEQWLPMHQHRRGQLLMPWYGLVKCELRDGLWPVLPDCAFSITANCSHRSFVSEQAKFCLLYLDEKSEVLPNVSCFVTLTPLVREMVWHMANVRPDYESASADGKIATALIGQLACMEVGHFSVSMPNNPRLRQIAECLLQDPASRRTVGEWANIIATSEKNSRSPGPQRNGYVIRPMASAIAAGRSHSNAEGGIDCSASRRRPRVCIDKCLRHHV